MNQQTLHAADGRPVFTPYLFRTGLLDTLDRQFPSTLYAWASPAPAPLALEIGHQGDSHFGYVHTGVAHVRWGPPPGMIPDGPVSYDFRLYAGQWFALPGMVRVSGGAGIVVAREGGWCLPLTGGPLERAGRLKYIDGCTDSLLAAPVRRGDPCLNLLYFPAGIDQTAHTHPSDRIGMILSGRGLCVVGQGEHQRQVDLVAGMIFCIHTDGLHKFATPYGQEMRVIAYHPDSDFGPTDEAHPMINRTMVDGVSAASLTEIHTQ
jgi:mannose-6-phosphate isomerase-like protein (cupin superfamily)